MSRQTTEIGKEGIWNRKKNTYRFGGFIKIIHPWIHCPSVLLYKEIRGEIFFFWRCNYVLVPATPVLASSVARRSHVQSLEIILYHLMSLLRAGKRAGRRSPFQGGGISSSLVRVAEGVVVCLCFWTRGRGWSAPVLSWRNQSGWCGCGGQGRGKLHSEHFCMWITVSIVHFCY